MYTKQDLIENKKLEKALRENKYRFRTQQIKKEKREKLEKVISCLLFGIGFIAVMFFIAFIESINF